MSDLLATEGRSTKLVSLTLTPFFQISQFGSESLVLSKQIINLLQPRLEKCVVFFPPFEHFFCPRCVVHLKFSIIRHWFEDLHRFSRAILGFSHFLIVISDQQGSFFRGSWCANVFSSYT